MSLDLPRSSQFSVRKFLIGLILSWYLVMKNIGVSVVGWVCDCKNASLRVFVLSYLESIRSLFLRRALSWASFKILCS